MRFRLRFEKQLWTEQVTNGWAIVRRSIPFFIDNGTFRMAFIQITSSLAIVLTQVYHLYSLTLNLELWIENTLSTKWINWFRFHL